MLFSYASIALLCLLESAKGEIHELIVGTFKSEFLYTLEFDSQALTLSLAQNLSTNASSSWINLSVDIHKLLGLLNTDTYIARQEDVIWQFIQCS